MTKAVNLIKRYFIKYKLIPSYKYVSTQLNISVKTAKEIIERLREQKVIIKKPDGSEYIQNAEAHDKTAPIKADKDITLKIIKILMAVIGGGASIMSVYYTATFLLEYLHPILAVMLSAIMVLFSVFCIDVMIIFYNNGNQRSLIALFAGAWLVVFLFSMVSTVIGQYNARALNLSEGNTVAESMTWELIGEQEETLKKEIEEAEKSLASFRKSFNTLSEKEDRNWHFYDARNKLKDAEILLTKKTNELKALQQERKDFLNKGMATAPKHDFYQWFGKAFGFNPDKVSFMVSILPAIFIDVIAPLAIAVSMFLKRRE
jgi:ABC-type multidrug transport system fused ATPase/permease subunit